MLKHLVAAAAQGSQTLDLRSRQGLDAVWTLIAIGVMAVLAALVFAIVPSLQSAGQQMQQTLQGAPWCQGPGC
jgi:flagellar biosynthesis protein FliQ